MDSNEYIKMYQFENRYWWYRGLHELVRFYVDRKKREVSDRELSILDAGCGTGRLMEILEPLGDVEGIDYSYDAISLCKERGLEQVSQEDLNTWNVEPGRYDVLISNDVISNIGVKDDFAVIEKFHAALKPGGLMILNLPAFPLLSRRHDIAISGNRRYRKNRTMEKVLRIGFEPVRCGYRLKPLFFIMLLQKYLIEPFEKGEPVSDLKPLPELLNRLLLGMHRLDNAFFRIGIPSILGSSLFLVCRKKAI